MNINLLNKVNNLFTDKNMYTRTIRNLHNYRKYLYVRQELKKLFSKKTNTELSLLYKRFYDISRELNNKGYKKDVIIRTCFTNRKFCKTLKSIIKTYDAIIILYFRFIEINNNNEIGNILRKIDNAYIFDREYNNYTYRQDFSQLDNREDLLRLLTYDDIFRLIIQRIIRLYKIVVVS